MNALHITSVLFWSFPGCFIEKDIKYTWNSPSQGGAKTYYNAMTDQICAALSYQIAFELRRKGSGIPQYLWSFNPTAKTQRCSAFDAKLLTGKTKAQGYLSGNSKCAEPPKSGGCLAFRWICSLWERRGSSINPTIVSFTTSKTRSPSARKMIGTHFLHLMMTF